MPTPDATSVAERPGPSMRRILGIGSLFVVGALLALFSLLAAIDEVRPDGERARLLGLALFGTLAAAQVGAAVLLLRGRRSGRAIGVLAALATLGLALLALVRSDPDGRSFATGLVVIVVVHVLLVIIGARLGD